MKPSRLALLAPLVLTTAACGGGSDEAVAVPDGESWCEIVDVSNSLDEQFDAADPADVGALRSIVPRIGELGPRFRAAAPDEISSQVDAYAEANSRLVAEFEEADFDIGALDDDAVEAIIDGVADESTEIDNYTFAECGEFLGPDNR